MATTGTHKRRGGPRGNVTGWSPGAARRNIAFLRSVDERSLAGHGYAITLTVRDCPATIESWSTSLTAWIKRQRRSGLIRLHWVMEYQSRGVPHLHVAAWYDNDAASLKALDDWIEITSHLRSGHRGQYIREIEGPIGWFQYMSKHCGRGSKHYQRQQNLLPAKWTKSPRVWGKSGEWPTVEVAEGQLTDNQFYRLRRLIRSLRVSQARRSVPGPGWSWIEGSLLTKQLARSMPIAPTLCGSVKTSLRSRLQHLRYVRTMLKNDDPKKAAVIGLSEWITPDVQDELLKVL